MESKCHLGRTILYDTVTNLSWGVDIRTHTIKTVIEKLLSGPWPPAAEDGKEVPKATTEEDCVVRSVCKIAGQSRLKSLFRSVTAGNLVITRTSRANANDNNSMISRGIGLRSI
jgi:SepF-like predicted cell division protein (DUF552 family)